MITDKELIDELNAESINVLAAAENKSMYERIMSRGGTVFYNAPCMVLILSDGSHYATIDCGILCQTVALAAHSLGLGNIICGMGGVPFTGERADELKKRLKFPDGYEFGISVLVGAANSGKEPHEPDPDKVTYIG